MADSKTFRNLIDDARFKGLDTSTPPRTMETIASRCRISVPYIYTLCSGKKVATPWATGKIARGLGLSETVVARALARSRENAILD